METVQEECKRCMSVARGIDAFCPVHGTVRLPKEKLQSIAADLDRRKENEVRKFILETVPQSVVTVPEQITERDWNRIQSIKEQFGFKTFGEVVEHLTKESAYRYDPTKSLESSRPLLVIGPPESGKTIFTKGFIKNYEKVFVVDVSKEYTDFKLVNIGDLFGNTIWQTDKRFRYIPEDNQIFSDMQMHYLFAILLGKMKEENSPMKDFCLVIEDAVRFSTIQSIRSFIAESRKFVKKVIVVCQDAKAYEGLGEVLKP